MIKTFGSWVKRAAKAVLPTCLVIAAACSSMQPSISRSRELRRHLDDIRHGSPFDGHVEWFRAQGDVSDTLRSEIRENWRSDPAYAVSLVWLGTRLPNWASDDWVALYKTLIRENLKDDQEHLANRKEVSELVIQCLYRLGNGEDSDSLLLDLAQVYPSDLVRHAAINCLCARWDAKTWRYRGAFLHAARSNTAHLAARAFEAMGQMRHREGRFIARRALLKAENLRSLRTAAARYLILLGDETGRQAVRAYLTELEAGLIDDGAKAGSGFVDDTRYELETLVEGMVMAPSPSVWTAELVRLAERDCVFLREEIASEIDANPDSDLLVIAKKLTADKNPQVRKIAEEAIRVIEISADGTGTSSGNENRE